jgi:large subunit ribosomal protein L35
MPKMKTKRAAAKRLSALGSGRFKKTKAGHRHKLSSKNRKQKRRLGKIGYIDSSDQNRIERLLPYAKK